MFFAFCISNLHAVDVENNCAVNFPKVTDESANNLIDIAYKAQDSAGNLDAASCIRLMYTVKFEVERLMNAKIKLDRFIDDAFERAERKGFRFTNKQKMDCKRDLLIFEKGRVVEDKDLFNFLLNSAIANNAHSRNYNEQQNYEAPLKLEVGLTLVIIGTVICIVPYPGCSIAGGIIAGTGFTYMSDACIKGYEKQDRNR